MYKIKSHRIMDNFSLVAKLNTGKQVQSVKNYLLSDSAVTYLIWCMHSMKSPLFYWWVKICIKVNACTLSYHKQIIVVAADKLCFFCLVTNFLLSWHYYFFQSNLYIYIWADTWFYQIKLMASVPEFVSVSLAPAMIIFSNELG